MRLIPKRTARGFMRADFNDANGTECSIQESSAADEPKLWLGRDSGTHHHITCECMARMHLTIEQVRALIPLLKRFVATGRILS